MLITLIFFLSFFTYKIFNKKRKFSSINLIDLIDLGSTETDLDNCRKFPFNRTNYRFACQQKKI
jgi:hypothetical protein